MALRALHVLVGSIEGETSRVVIELRSPFESIRVVAGLTGSAVQTPGELARVFVLVTIATHQRIFEAQHSSPRRQQERRRCRWFRQLAMALEARNGGMCAPESELELVVERGVDPRIVE